MDSKLFFNLLIFRLFLFFRKFWCHFGVKKYYSLKYFDYFCQNKFCLMESFGEIIKNKRESKGLILRQVASALDIDQAIVSKFERGERKPSKEQVEKFAEFYGLDKNKLITSWLSDQIANTILYEENIGEVLKVAEEKAIYLKTIQHGK